MNITHKIKHLIMLILVMILYQESAYGTSGTPDLTDSRYYSDSELSFAKKIYYRLTSRSGDVDDNAKLINQYIIAAGIYNAYDSRVNKIPKIMHHVWLGDKPLPPLYARYINQCKSLHPAWEHKLWTNADTSSFAEPIQKLISESKSYHEQSDILRLAILKQDGGVYLDADIKCINSFDDLTERYNFIVSIDYAKRRVLNGIIGSTKNNQIVESALNDLHKNFHERFTQFFIKKYDPNDPLKTFHRLAVERTMLPLNNAVLNYPQLDEDKELMVLPLEYCMKPYGLSFVESVKRFMGYYLEKSNAVDFYKFAKCFHDPKPSNSYIGFPRFIFALGKTLTSFQSMLSGIMNNAQVVDFYKYLYENNYPAQMQMSNEEKIPKILHFTRTDSTGTKKYSDNLKSYKTKLWSKADKEQLLSRHGFNSISDEAARDMVAVLLILQTEGGIAVNDDLVVSRDIEDLLYQYNLILTLNTLENYKDKIQISARLLAAAKNQIYLTKVLEIIYTNQSDISSADDVLMRLGQVILENYPLNRDFIVFPGHFFYSNNSNSTYTYYED